MTTPESAPPNAIDWRNLIRAGRELLTPSAVADMPTGEHIRRAVSSAYYAMFHALAMSNANALVGAPLDPATSTAWSRGYRGLDHGTARRELQRHRHEYSASARVFADAFQELQNQRHEADYNHSASFTARQANAWLARAETAILAFLQADHSERSYIAALTLIRGR